MNLTLVYIVAGMSSRFGGKIKQFAKVGPNNETLIELSLDQAIKAKFSKIIFVVGNLTEQPFKKMFGDNYKRIPIEYALQKFNPETRYRPWGTCDAVCSAINLINEPFVIATGDDIYGEKTFEILTNHLQNSQGDATIAKNLIEMLPEKGSVSRGIFETDNENNVLGGTESIDINRQNFKERGFNEKTPVSISIFALHPKTLQLLKEKLEQFKIQNSEDKKIECFLNTTLISLIKENKTKMKLYYTPEKWLGITNPDDEENVKRELNKIN